MNEQGNAWVSYTVPHRFQAGETNADMFVAAVRREQQEKQARARRRAYKKAMRKAEVAIKAAGIMWVMAVALFVFSLARVVM